jgi:hypothetical protein
MLNEHKEVLILVASGLSANPRAIKALQALSERNMKVKVVAFDVGSWISKKDLDIIRTYPESEFYFITALRKADPYLFTAHLLHKVALFLYSINKKSLLINAWASNKRIAQLHMWLLNNAYLFKSTTHILAFNYGSIVGAYAMSKKFNAKLALDFEDYYPGEKISGRDQEEEVRRRKRVISWILNKKSRYTYAAPLIMEKFLLDNRVMDSTHHKVINNVFSRTEFQKPRPINTGALQLVWFSQNISYGRGLEEFLTALEEFNAAYVKAEVTLIGNLNPLFFKNYIKDVPYIKLIDPLNQRELNLKLADYEVGLALEMDSTDLNRQICLTNKIWAYFQAGLYIIATDTDAQVNFLSQNREHGIICQQNSTSLKMGLEVVYENKEMIRKNRLNRYSSAQDVSWEKESIHLLSIL